MKNIIELASRMLKEARDSGADKNELNQVKQYLRVNLDWHPTKKRPSAEARKAKRKAQRRARRITRQRS